jgi:hypothetical protein
MNGGQTAARQAPVPVSPVPEENRARLREWFDRCDDIVFRNMALARGGTDGLLVYCDGLSDSARLNETVLRELLGAGTGHETAERPDTDGWPMSALDRRATLDEAAGDILDGRLVMFLPGRRHAFVLDMANPPRRMPEEAPTEVSIRGPRDGFVEDLTVNVALVRKRLRTASLACEYFVIGKRSLVKAALLYIKDIARPEMIAAVRERLNAVDIDAVQSNDQLEHRLTGSRLSPLPVFHYSGRPDHVAASLLRGRFAIAIDGVPNASIAPANLYFLLSSPEDLHNHYLNIFVGRLLRFLGLVISLFLPGFYIAVTTYHPDQIPLTLLATITLARKGVPVPAPVEAFLMLLAFELFREAGVRLPRAIGQTLTVVGGLIIGDAAIRAGMTSPSLQVVIATTAVATFAIANRSLAGTVGLLRIGVLVLSSLLGVYGFILSAFAIIVLFASTRSFGLPYLTPISPFNAGDATAAIRTILRIPGRRPQQRPEILRPVDPARTGGDSE